jgi:hypothetical protein
MKADKRIPFAEVVHRLAVATGYDFRLSHLAVLISCWRRRHPEQAPGFATLRARKRRYGYPWLSRRELIDFGRYAGYDISHP